jgi:ArsR family transcriptional regulator
MAGLDPLIDIMKAIGEPSRFRILALLSSSSLTVSDITRIVGQSQPRVSRHLKLLLDAGLIVRHQEGSWAWFDLADDDFLHRLVALLIEQVDGSDPDLLRDRQRLERVREERAAKAAEYFAQNAASWDEIRGLHAPDAAVEAAVRRIVGTRPIQAMLDLGTGTGRMLQLFSDLYVRGVGVDASREMLAIARANLDGADLRHVQVRQGDLMAPPVEAGAFDLVTIHQVLHYLDEPERAIAEAAHCLRPGGRLVVVDFAPHANELLRDRHAHVRFGFSDKQMQSWFSEAGLEIGAGETISSTGDTPDALAVKIWSARDPRLLMADEPQGRARISEIA